MFNRLGANKAFNAIWGIAGKGFNQMGRGVTAARRGWGGLAGAEKMMAGVVGATGLAAGAMTVGAFRADTRQSRGFGAPPRGWKQPADYKGGAWWAQ